MGTRLREKIYSPLSVKEAHALVDELSALIDSMIDADSDGDDDADPDLDGETYADVFDDVFFEAEDAPPPTPAEAKAVAGAALEPAALERLPSCRSSLVLEYDDHIGEKAPFIGLQKLLYARAGNAVVSRDEGAQVSSIETTMAEHAKKLGSVWTKTDPLGARESTKAPSSKTPPSKEGELEAMDVHKRLSRAIEGKDPLAREALRRELERTTDAVRTYAALLMDLGPRSDAALAKEMPCSVAEAAAARELLKAILKKIR